MTPTNFPILINRIKNYNRYELAKLLEEVQHKQFKCTKSIYRCNSNISKLKSGEANIATEKRIADEEIAISYHQTLSRNYLEQIVIIESKMYRVSIPEKAKFELIYN